METVNGETKKTKNSIIYCNTPGPQEYKLWTAKQKQKKFYHCNTPGPQEYKLWTTKQKEMQYSWPSRVQIMKDQIITQAKTYFFEKIQLRKHQYRSDSWVSEQSFNKKTISWVRQHTSRARLIVRGPSEGVSVVVPVFVFKGLSRGVIVALRKTYE